MANRYFQTGVHLNFLHVWKQILFPKLPNSPLGPVSLAITGRFVSQKVLLLRRNMGFFRRLDCAGAGVSEVAVSTPSSLASCQGDQTWWNWPRLNGDSYGAQQK